MADLLKPAAAADYLGISTRQLLDLTNEGLIRWINIGLGEKRPTRRYLVADLDAFKEERAQKCRSIKEPVRRSTPTISNIVKLDFLALRDAQRAAKRKPSKSGNANAPARS